MAVTCTGEGRALTIAVSGEVDHHGAKTIMEELERYVDAALPNALTLDLGGVTFMDSSGIAVLIRAYRRVQGLGGTLTVVNIPPQAARVLQAAGLNQLIQMA